MTYPGISGITALSLALWILAPPVRAEARGARTDSAGAPGSELSAAYGRLPLAFQENRGQVDPRVRFTAHGAGVDLFLTDAGGVLALAGDPASSRRTAKRGARARPRPPPQHAAAIQMCAVGAAPATPVGIEALPGTANYFIGRDPARWLTGVPTFAKVKYPEIYPGVDLVFHGRQRQLEYDFVVAPGADPSAIRMAFDGAESLRLSQGGDLILTVAGRELVQRRPQAYEEEGDGAGAQATSGLRPLEVSYVLAGQGQIAFRVIGRDPARRLIIDPVLVYSTYLGGSSYDVIEGIAVDRWGNALVAGTTTSTDFPVVDPVRPSHGGGTYDAFVTKLNARGDALVYATYLGGSAEDGANGVAVDQFGNAYVSGGTASPDFPLSRPLQPAFGGETDAFVVKLDPRGSALVYSTYLGGSRGDWGGGIAVDFRGAAYVTGQTFSSDYPTSNPLQPALQGSGDAFTAMLVPSGRALAYSTFLGGSAPDGANAIAVDWWGRAYILGITSSDDFPTVNALQATRGSAWDDDAFVARFSPGGRSLDYSTYLGGSSIEEGTAIAADPLCGVYVAGNTWSLDFPTARPLQPANAGGGGDAFVARIGCRGDRLDYSTYLGGSKEDRASGIALDLGGRAYVTGLTYSTDFPKANPLQEPGGDADAFVLRLDPSGAALEYSTPLGGSFFDRGDAIAVDSWGNAYVAGLTFSEDFPTVNPLQPEGAFNPFVAKLSP
jgi:hypothetical protein